MERTVMRGAGGKQIADHGLGPILDKPEWHYAGRPLVGLAMRDAMQRVLVASLRPPRHAGPGPLSGATSTAAT